MNGLFSYFGLTVTESNLFLYLVIFSYAALMTATIFNSNVRRLVFRGLSLFNNRLSFVLSRLVGISEQDQNSYSKTDIRKLIDEATKSNRLQNISFSQQTESIISDEFKKALGNKLNPIVEKQLLQILSDNVSKRVFDRSFEYLQSSISRLNSASSTVTIRGFINLLIGIAFAGWALYLLKEAADLFSPAQLGTMSTNSVFYLIGMRISLGLIITLISYFFLTLYKKSLDDSKYYQNEITNISAFAAALNLTYSSNIAQNKSIVITKLMEVDRNMLMSSTKENVIDRDLLKTVLEKILEKMPGSDK